MKRRRRYSLITLIALVIAFPVMGHHAAQGIVDEEIYIMIDEMVADTPHGAMTLEDLGGGMTEIVIRDSTLQSIENLIDDGLLTYASMLDGEVDVSIVFENSRAVVLTITQVE